MEYSKKFLAFVFLFIASFVVPATIFAAGNISTTDKYSQFLNIDLDSNGTNDFVNWSPANGGATVTDSAITGYIWGETTGWINLNPTSVQVANSCTGILGGYAWGENAGWINFAPTNATGSNQPKINTTTGAITGMVWTQNYGWLRLDSQDGTYPGLTTTWTPTCSPGGTNGACGGSNGASFSSAPSSNLCSSGTASSVVANGSSGWLWTCAGSGGGTTASCSASKTINPSGGSPLLYTITNVTGGINSPSDFTIFVKDAGNNNLFGSPKLGTSTPPGSSYSVVSGTYTINVTAPNGYTISFAGNCNPLGQVSISSVNATCIINATYNTNPLVCTDPAAINTGGSLPCQYSAGTCQDQSATNFGQALPCTYSQGVCTDYGALNHNDPLPCVYPQGVCSDPAAINTGSLLPCKYGGPDGPGGGTSTPPTTTSGGTTTPPTTTSGGTSTWSILPSGWTPTLPKINYGAVGTIVGVIGVLSSIPGLITRIGNLFLTLAFGRKKRRGVVFDSKTEQPLDPAYVSVVNTETGAEVSNAITDMDGRFGFVLKPGTYRIVANKTHYQFPSQRLAGKTRDDVYDNLYFGEPFTVADNDEVTTMNIPMDAIGTDWNQEEKKRMNIVKYFIENQRVFGYLFDVLFVIGFVVSIVITYYYPIWWNFLMIGLYIVLVIFQMIGLGPISPGKITKAGMPLSGAVIRVFNATLNREVAHKVATEQGSYYLLVPKADYYITIEQSNPDGTHTKLFTSTVMKATHGIINKSFDL